MSSSSSSSSSTTTTTTINNRPETKYRRKLLAVCPGEELLGPLDSSSSPSPLTRPPPPQQLEAYLGKLRKLLEHAESRRLKGSPPLDVKVAEAVQVRACVDD
jgi:hypothetical protein